MPLIRRLNILKTQKEYMGFCIQYNLETFRFQT